MGLLRRQHGKNCDQLLRFGGTVVEAHQCFFWDSPKYMVTILVNLGVSTLLRRCMFFASP